MTRTRIIGLALTTVGVILIIWGALTPSSAGSADVVDAAARGARLGPTLVIGGVAAAIAGCALLLFGPRKALG